MGENPYRVVYPGTDLTTTNQASVEGRLFRKGSLLIIHLVDQKATFPDRCILSNEPTGFRLKTVLYWHLPIFYLLILAGPVVYVLVAMFIRKKAEFTIPLAERFISNRRQNVVLTVLLLIAGMASIVFGISVIDSPDSKWSFVSNCLILLGPTLMLFAGLLGIYGCRIVFPKFIDDNYAKIGGVGTDFLASLPEWPHSFP